MTGTRFKRSKRGSLSKPGPEREWQGDRHESSNDPSPSRASETKENDLGDLAGAVKTPDPNHTAKPSPDEGDRASAPPEVGVADRHSA